MDAQLELAWANITHNKTRTAAGVAGVAFAVLLLFMQLGFYDTSYRSSTLLLDQFDFEVAVRSPQYRVPAGGRDDSAASSVSSRRRAWGASGRTAVRR